MPRHAAHAAMRFTMPSSLTRSSRAQPEPVFPRSFGQRAPAPGDRWPMPLAAAAILAMSLAGWVALIQLGRLASTLAG